MGSLSAVVSHLLTGDFFNNGMQNLPAPPACEVTAAGHTMTSPVLSSGFGPMADGQRQKFPIDRHVYRPGLHITLNLSTTQLGLHVV
jgi:hypothetical protein